MTRLLLKYQGLLPPFLFSFFFSSSEGDHANSQIYSIYNTLFQIGFFKTASLVFVVAVVLHALLLVGC